MAEFPGLGHVAVTVTDIDRGREWYSTLFGTQPVLDEDTGSFYHVVWALGGESLFGIHTHPRENDQHEFSEFRMVWITSPSAFRAERSWSRGRSVLPT